MNMAKDTNPGRRHTLHDDFYASMELESCYNWIEKNKHASQLGR